MMPAMPILPAVMPTGTLGSAPAPVAPAPQGITGEQIRGYIASLQNDAGLSGDALHQAMYDAANQYGVSNQQVADAMGWNVAQVDQYVNENYAPQQPSQSLKQAQDLTMQAGSYTPERVSVPNQITAGTVSAGGPISSQGYTSQGYTADQIANRDLNPYLNPYTQNVIDTTMGQMERAQQGAINNLGFAASRAGAFGGSRHGVAEGTSWGDYGRNVGQMAAGLNQANMQNAFNLAGQDVGFTNQASQFTAGAANQAAQFGADAANRAAMQTAANQLAASQANAQLQMQAQQSNAANALQAAIANQGAGLQGASLGMQAGSQMGNLANLGYNQAMGLNEQLWNQGAAEQATNQALIDSYGQQYGGFQNQLMNSLGFLSGALGGMNPNTTTTGGSNSLMDLLGMGFYGYGQMRG